MSRTEANDARKRAELGKQIISMLGYLMEEIEKMWRKV